MAVQVSYPGVYIDEFAPGAPIQGVGTSTAAFIGTASQGPIGKPTLIQSWDAFVATFGGFIVEQPTSYLAPAVFGFFLNGGTTCYVLRVGTGVMASANLTSHQPPDPALIVRALQEGPSGNALSVEVIESSRLADMLASIGVEETTLVPAHASANITAVSDDRRTLTVSDNAGFASGDRLLLTDSGQTNTAIVQIDTTSGTQTINLKAPISGTVDFVDGTVRIADLVPGQRSIRLNVPNNLRLNQAVPRGTTVSITLGTTTEIHTVDSSGGDSITLKDGLLASFDMDDPNALPRIATLEFDLIVNDTGSGETETFEQLSMNPEHPSYWSTLVVSEFISVQEPSAPPAPMPSDPRPAAGNYPLTGGVADDRASALVELNATPTTQLDLLKPYDEVAMVCIPGAIDANVQQAMIAHCEFMYDRFAILDSRPGATPGNGIRDQFADVRSERGFAALYYPWILVRNPLTGKDELIPPSGHVAGVYARTDAQRGVHKAPANTNIRGALGLERLLTNDEQGPLNLLGINALRVFPGQAQPLVWGARTTANDRNWQYVNIRRLFLYIEESIEEGIRWAVFEPNNLELWQKLKRTITEFLNRVWRDGALFGATAKEAFYVRIDEALNPPSTQALGRLYIEIGVRPTYPAEFIILRIGIWRGGSEVSES